VEAKIVILPGDGIGAEVVAEAQRVLESIASIFGHSFAFEDHLFGGSAMDQGLEPLPDTTRDACLSASAVLLGAVGNPKWDDLTAKTRPENATLELRTELGVYANLRPIPVYPELIEVTPFKRQNIKGVDLLIIRELTGGLHYGKPSYRAVVNGQRHAIDTLRYSEEEIRRVLAVAFRLAKDRRCLVTSVDKANIMESSRLWRQIANEVHAEHPDVQLEHKYVDVAALHLVQAGAKYDVVVTENMFGDILSEAASAYSGSLGMVPSASIGDGDIMLYEPIHGSAPDIAGKGIANPIGAILSAAMLLDYSLGLKLESDAVHQAVADAIASGARTADISTASHMSTTQMGNTVIKYLEKY